MKFPIKLYYNNPQISKIYDIWAAAAINQSLQYGIYIEAELIYDVTSLHNGAVGIQFKVMDREFGSLKDLIKALELKAFM